MDKNTQVNLNVDELKDVLRHVIKNNQLLQSQGKNPLTVCINGESGIGKTSVVQQLGEELDLQVIKLNLSMLEDLGDLVGIPLRQFQLCKENTTKTVQVEEFVTESRKVKIGESFVEKPVKVKKLVSKTVEVPGECIWVDEHAIDQYTKQDYNFTGEKRMGYCAPEWVADRREGFILCLDDFTRANSRFMQAAMELINCQTYISWKLPPNSHVILTTNPCDSTYLVQSEDEAQESRRFNINLKFDIECWSRYATKENIESRSHNFLLLHPELVTPKCNPRSITNFFNGISSIKDFAKELPLIQMLAEASVGPEFGMLFTSFINNRLHLLISPHKMLLHTKEDEVLAELKQCIGVGDDYRADIASILTTRLINFTCYWSESNQVTQVIIDRLIAITKDPVILTDDLKYVLIKKLLAYSKQRFQKLLVNEEMIKLAIK